VNGDLGERRQVGGPKETRIQERFMITIKQEEEGVFSFVSLALSRDHQADGPSQCVTGVIQPLSHHDIHEPSDDMRLPGFLSLPRKDRRARSRVRSEADAIQDPSRADLAISSPAGSDPDPGTGSSTLPTFGPSTSQNWVSSGTETSIILQGIHLKVLPHNVDNIVSDHMHPDTSKDKRPKPWDRILNRGATASENKSEASWKSTAYASAKVVVDVVKESSDVFPPLKSVVGGLTAVLNHYDVWSVSLAPPMILMYYPSKRQLIDKR